MTTQVQLRRGTTAQNDAFTGAQGEVTVDITLNRLRVHDGSTPGGTVVGGAAEVPAALPNNAMLFKDAAQTGNWGGLSNIRVTQSNVVYNAPTAADAALYLSTGSYGAMLYSSSTYSWCGLDLTNGGVGTGTATRGIYYDGGTNKTRIQLENAEFCTGNNEFVPDYVFAIRPLTVEITTAGVQLKSKEGTNSLSGVATLVGGTVTVSNANITASSRIFLTGQNSSGTPGDLYVSARSNGVSFTITSTSGSDTRDVAYFIVEGF